MKTEGKLMLQMSPRKLKSGILTISAGNKCPVTTTCCFPLKMGAVGDRGETAEDSEEEPGTGMRTRRRGLLLLGTIGSLLVAVASLVYVINPLQIIINTKLAFDGESYLYRMWQRPPVNVYVKVFVFNVTNHQEFLDGAKMRVEEVGPFVYREELEHTNVSFNSNNSVTYIPRRKVTWIPEMSTKIPLDARLIVPNIPLIGFASMLANASMFTNVALASLASYLDCQPFLDLSVHEYLWGYDEPLVKLASHLFPNWIPFESFGLLDRLFDDGDNVVTMNLNMTTRLNDDGRLITPLTIDKYNGLSGLSHWGYQETVSGSQHKCNTLQGMATEGVLFPRSLSKNDSFLVYRKAFCRTLSVVFDREGPASKGLPAYWYKLPENVFDNDNPENSCYCNREDGPCLPRGLSDMSTCIYGIPAAVSFPHFYQSDPSLLESVEGMRPVKEDHASIIVIQKDFGIPMQVHSRIQTNIIVKKTRFNPRVLRFNGMVLPVFWVDLCIEELPAGVLNLLSLLVTVGPVLVRTVEYGLATLGVAMALVAVLAYVVAARMFPGRKSGDKLWDADYRSVKIVPVIRSEEYQ